MYIRFTPLQLKKTKEFMKSVKLSAYDITIYNEILRALDKPEDEIKQSKQQINEKYVDRNIILEPPKLSESESKNEKNTFKSTDKIKKYIKSDNFNKLDNTNDIRENNKLVIDEKTKPLIPVISIDDLETDNVLIDEQLNNIDEKINNIQLDNNQQDFNSEFENAPPMSVIDNRRIKKKTTGYYI